MGVGQMCGGRGRAKKSEFWAGVPEKKNKEKKGAGVGRKKLGWGRGVEYLGVGDPDPPVLLHHIA